MKYRYVIHKYDWMDSDEDWQQMIDYVRARFTHVTALPLRRLRDEVIFFNATPEQVVQMAKALKIGTTGFSILTASNLEPSTHRE